MILVDTSALFALLDADDHNHRTAARYWEVATRTPFVTHGYVASESVSLVRRRLGWAAVERLMRQLLPRMDVEPVDRELHERAVAIYLAEGGGTSFVDRVSIEFARRERISEAFAFDPDLVAGGLPFPRVMGGETE